MLVRFPFSDIGGSKQRPAVVLSSDAYHRRGADVVFLAIASQDENPGPFDHPLSDWKSAGLLRPSSVRTGKVATLDRSMIRRTLGRLTDSDLLGVEKKVKSALGLAG